MHNKENSSCLFKPSRSPAAENNSIQTKITNTYLKKTANKLNSNNHLQSTNLNSYNNQQNRDILKYEANQLHNEEHPYKNFHYSSKELQNNTKPGEKRSGNSNRSENDSCLIDEQSSEFGENFIQPMDTKKNQEKKNRPKFTILDDDLEDLNQAINGPGCKQQFAKTQEALQNAYKKLQEQQQDNSFDSSLSKDSENSKQNQKQNHINVPQQSNKINYFSKTSEQGDLGKPNKINNRVNQIYCSKKSNENINRGNSQNISNETKKIKKFNENIDSLKAPRIFVNYKRIDLFNAPKDEDFYMTGLKDQIKETRVPNNSVIGSRNKNNNQQLLFEKALLEKKSFHPSNRFDFFHARS